MEWNKSREKLNMSVSDINYIGKSETKNSNWKTMRNKVLNKTKNSCRYCGGRYSKYLICFHLDKDGSNNKMENLDMCCKMCYIITNLNYGHFDDIILCWSKMSQLDIVKNTINYVLQKHRLPTIEDIDKNAKKLSLSVIELCSALLENEKIFPEIENYKIFFTTNLDTLFTDYYIGKRSSMFIENDTDSENLSDYLGEEQEDCDNENGNLYNNITSKLEEHVFCSNEKNFLDNFFSIKTIDRIDDMMTTILDKNIYLIEQDKKKSEKNDLNFNIIYNKIKKLLIHK